MPNLGIFVWNDPSYGSGAVKPTCQLDKRQFPQTDYFFHSGLGEWHGYSSPYDGDGKARKSHNLGREFFIEAAREAAKEMAVLAVIVVASAWPVIYMVITVVKLLMKGRPLTE